MLKSCCQLNVHSRVGGLHIPSLLMFFIAVNDICIMGTKKLETVLLDKIS